MNTAFALTPYEDVVDDTVDEDGNKVQFTFDELSESAKDKARNNERYSEHYLSHEWWDDTYDNAVTIGRLVGIEVGTNQSWPHSGKSHSKPDINFSGFCSQGDGCCYSGDLHIEDLKDCVIKLREHTGEGCTDEALFALAAQGEAVYEAILVNLVTLRMTGNEEDLDEEIGLAGIVQIESNNQHYRTATTHNYCADEDVVGTMDAYVSSFADWIYNQLEAEHDHLMSDACVDESIAQYENLYDEDGNEV